MDVLPAVHANGAVHVLATTFEGTRAALRAAIPLARGSDARVIVIVPKIVSYALPVDERIDSSDFIMRRYREMARELDGEPQFRLCLCRRVDDMLRQLLPPAARVVVGGRVRSWLPTEETRLVRQLTARGHDVVFVPLEVQ
jgi:hypothetical protein